MSHFKHMSHEIPSCQGNTYRAQVAAVAKATSAQTKTRPRAPTLCVTEPPMRDRNVPHLPGFDRMGMLSDLRNDHPEYAYEIATGLESILFLGTPGTSTATTLTKTNSREIATCVGVNLNKAPVNRDKTRTPQLTDDQMRKAFSVIPNYYWQLNCWTCRECGHSTFTCPTLAPTQRMYFAYQYYLDQVRTNPSMETFLAEKTQRRIDLARERREGTDPRTDQRNNVTHDRRTLKSLPKSILTNPSPRFERPPERNANGYQRNNDYDRRSYGGPRRNDDYRRTRRPHFDKGVYVTDNVRNEDERHEYEERERRNNDDRPEWARNDDAKPNSDSENE